MKFSLFNIWSLVNGELVLFNTLSGSVATFSVNDEQAAVKQSLDNNEVGLIPSQFLDAMMEDGYIVESNRDELGSIRLSRLERLSRTDEFSLCVTLNQQCNFGCLYCFQSHSGNNLAREKRLRIIQMFESILPRAKRVELDWFGGEPLLSFSDLQETNDLFIQLSKDSGVDYSYSITTNGYLMTQEIIGYLKKEKPSRVTITLDGPPRTHNKSRPLKSGGETFDTIMQNIKQAAAAGLRVFVRVNVSSLNVQEVPELFDILESNGLKNRVKVDLQGVVSSEAHPCEEYCLDGYDLAHSILSIYLGAARKGWLVLPPTNQMQLLGFCIGEFPNRIITDINGNTYRCTQMSPEQSTGKIVSDGKIERDETRDSPWTNKDPLTFEECRSCALLPLCMGGCNLLRTKGVSECCLGWKYDIPTFLEVILANEENLVGLAND